MISTDREVCMTPSEADRVLSWPLEVLKPYIANGLVFYQGRRVRVIDRFGSELGVLASAPRSIP